MNKKWALFFSGRGSNLEAILSCYHTTWTETPLVVTNNPQAEGILKARKFNIEPLILDTPINYIELSQHLKNQGVEAIFLLGYLKIIPAVFLKEWKDRVFNLHPSLLPLYPGLKSIERAVAEKSDIGVTIHKVTELVDEGQILVQQVAVTAGNYDGLSLEEIKGIVHSKEHQIVCDFIPMGEQHLGSKI